MHCLPQPRRQYSLAPKQGEGFSLREDGDTEIAFADAPREQMLAAEYKAPYLAHHTMEPMNATAWLRDGKLDIWTGTQGPTLTRSDAAFEVGVEEEQVEIHTTYLGGGFGRRSELDFTRFAARVAKATDGKPVQVVWTREEDMTHDTYRPGAICKLRAKIDDSGNLAALEVNASLPSIMASIMGRALETSAMGPDATMFQGLVDQPYKIENHQVRMAKADVDIPIGFWRSVGHSHNAYFMEAFMDELALKAGKNPLDYRLALLTEHPEAVGVLEKVAEMSNFTAPAEPGRGKGIAFHLSFGAWTAQVVEVSVNEGVVKIENVWCAADLGTVLDPAIVKTQMQSGIIYGLSAAMGQEITFADGKVEQSNFHDYDAMRMHQCPNIEVELLNNSKHMGGAGEPGTPPAVPALGNAIFAATGTRLREMPFSKEVEFFA